MTVPLPPGDLATRKPRFLTLPADTVVHRFYAAAFNPIFFDRTLDGRFNAPDASYGVCYAAREVEGAFAETFLRKPGFVGIAPDFLAKKAYVKLKTIRQLTLIEFTGPGLAILGATAEVSHISPPYSASHAWSKAIHAHPSGPDGIAYMSRHDDQRLCYALFDRPPGAVAEVERETELDTDWFWRIALIYGTGLV